MGKRKGTPEELDVYFDRAVIPEDGYVAFWQAWDKASREERREIMAALDAKLVEQETRAQAARLDPLPPMQSQKVAWTFAEPMRGTVKKKGRQYQAVPPAAKAGPVTKSKRAAERLAKAMGGTVVRRDAKGRFNKRGRSYQAVPRRKR